MQKFSQIHQRAVKNKGSKSNLLSSLPIVTGSEELSDITNDRFLSEMSRCVFQAGFVWRVVNQKWESFEKVFFNFDPEKMVLLSPDQLDAIGQNPAIIRNAQKIASIQKNAQFILDQAKQHGTFANFIDQWPGDDIIGLFSLLKKKGSRLGGATGSRMLRNLGIDTYILTQDVVLCLQRAGVQINDNPSSKKDGALVQIAFNTWHRETGLPYSHLSKICACSIAVRN